MWRMLGFDREKEFFDRAVRLNKIKHAYLFSGQEMIGKRTLALELASKLTGIEDSGSASAQFDILVINSASSASGQTISIDAVKEMKNRLSRGAYLGKHKCCIIDDAHQLTDEAQNTMLKILEEPAEKVTIFLITSKPGLLKFTVRSRCEEIFFAPHNRKVLESVLEKEKLSERQKNFLIDFCGGRVGLLIDVVRRSAYDEIKKTIEELAELEKSGITAKLEKALAFANEDEDIFRKKILYWMLYLRTKLPSRKYADMLGLLQELNAILDKPYYNRRLAIENFLLRI